MGSATASEPTPHSEKLMGPSIQSNRDVSFGSSVWVIVHKVIKPDLVACRYCSQTSNQWEAKGKSAAVCSTERPVWQPHKNRMVRAYKPS